jgi:hypothetical protein
LTSDTHRKHLPAAAISIFLIPPARRDGEPVSIRAPIPSTNRSFFPGKALRENPKRDSPHSNGLAIPFIRLAL